MPHNREETSLTGQVVAKDTNEELIRFKGDFDRAARTWKIDRLVWHQPGILLRRETEFRTAFGKPIAARAGDEFEIRPQYDVSGREQGRDVRFYNPTSAQFDVLVRREDEFRWRGGGRDARVRAYVGGKAYDLYRSLTGSEGR